MSVHNRAISDEVLLQVASQHKDIESLLDTIFGFFARKTDLYHTLKSPADTTGFPPGKAQDLVVKAFRKFLESEDPPAEASRGSAINEPTIPPPVTVPNVVHSGGISTWNGAVTDRYRWTQSIGEVTVEFPLPQRVCSRKDLVVELTNSGVSITVSGESVISGKFTERINASESTWTLDDSVRVTLTLAKSREAWWKGVLMGDPEIDTTKVESTKRIDEYDEETQGAIRKVLFDENQKRRGLMTSDELGMSDKLKAAWNAEGSPFAGTEFDPSIVMNRPNNQ